MSNPEARLEHSGAAGPTKLAVGISASDFTFQIVDATGWPSGAVGKFIVTLERGLASEEKLLCDSRSGSVITINASGRGYDGSVPRAHDANVSVEHTVSAIEIDNANKHTASVAGVHGVTGNVVGTTDTQALTNKTLSDASNTFPVFPQTQITGLVAALAGKAASVHTHVEGDVTNLTADLATLSSNVSANTSAIALRELAANKGIASGYASLDGSVKVPFAQLPTGASSSQVSVGNHTHTPILQNNSGTAGNFVTSGSPGPTYGYSGSFTVVGGVAYLVFISILGVKCRAAVTGGVRFQVDVATNSGTVTYGAQNNTCTSTGYSFGTEISAIWIPAASGSKTIGYQGTYLNGDTTGIDLGSAAIVVVQMSALA